MACSMTGSWGGFSAIGWVGHKGKAFLAWSAISWAKCYHCVVVVPGLGRLLSALAVIQMCLGNQGRFIVPASDTASG